MSVTTPFPATQRWLRRASKRDAWAATRASILENDAANALYPQFVDKATGPYMWDVDHTRFVDYILGYGPVVLGHADAHVNEAVVAELQRGVCISPLWSRRQVELAELLYDVIPGAEQAYFMKTGSDATSAAVRLARIATGRDKIAKWGYNGWHDWTAPRPLGVPDQVRADTLHFAYNNVPSLEELFDQHPDEIACVIMMTYGLEMPTPDFLTDVKAVANRHGAVFVLDEMRSGFRMALGGGQEYFGVTADLATFSKAMSNGYAISALTGSRDLLAGLSQTHMSSTFYANPPEMAAAVATIQSLRNNGGPDVLWSLGSRLFDGLQKIVASSGMPAKVVGSAISPFIDFDDDENAQHIKVDFFSGVIRRGVFLHPNHQWYLSTAHTEEIVDESLAICAEAADIAVRSADDPSQGKSSAQ